MKTTGINLIAFVAAFLLAAPSHAQPRFGLNGFSLGDAMTTCPTFSQPAPKQIDRLNGCSVPMTLVLGRPVVDFQIEYADGRVITVMAEAEGCGMTTAVMRDALTGAYGAPKRTQNPTEEYTWRTAGRHLITLECDASMSYTTVFVLDLIAHRELQPDAVLTR